MKEIQKIASLNALEDLKLADFGYALPEDRIAKHPVTPRHNARLLSYKRRAIRDFRFKDLPSLLPSNSLLVFNQTQVLPARLLFQRKTGAQIEVLLLHPEAPSTYPESLQARNTCTWKAMVGNKKRWKDGETLECMIQSGEEQGLLKISWADRGQSVVCFTWEQPVLSFAEIIGQLGQPPLPPYLNRQFEPEDLHRYQTVYAKEAGAVAAPTAGLHFTEEILVELTQKQIATAFLTLHVGAGTFAPVKTDKVIDHAMHAESFSVSAATLSQLMNHEGPIIPVGTTSLRVIESLYWLGIKALNHEIAEDTPLLHLEQTYPYKQQSSPIHSYKNAYRALDAYLKEKGKDRIAGSSQLYIVPGYTFGVAKGILTNFHQPHSTLILLIAALLGEDWRTVYTHAMDTGYRFLSYGDSSLLLP